MGPLESRGAIVDIRRALSIGGTAVVAAAVGAACSFAFSGAIALNDAAGVQVSESAVIVPAAHAVDTVYRTPRSPDAAGPEIVPAPEPHDLAPTTGGGNRGDADSLWSAGGDAGAPGGSSSGGGITTAPGLVGGTPGTSEQAGAHSNREWAHQHAPGLNKLPDRNDALGKGQGSDEPNASDQADSTRPGDAEECDPDSDDQAGVAADRSSDPDASCTGGG